MSGPATSPPATGRQNPIVNIRFPPSPAAMARRLAEQDGVTLSAWVRRIVAREIGQREGTCPTCGHEVRP